MAGAAAKIVSCVIVCMNCAGLVGRKWRDKGDEFPLLLERAKDLKERKLADGVTPTLSFVGDPIDGPFPEEEQPTGRRRSKPMIDNNGGEEDGSNDPNNDADETLEDFGIAGKTIKLLAEAGYSTTAELKSAIADGVDLTEINGIGKQTAASIAAQLGV